MSITQEQLHAALQSLLHASEKQKVDQLQPNTENDSSTGLSCKTPKTSGFTVSELLEQKKKNAISTKAQELFLYTVRESAKIVGLWEKAPHINEVPYATMASFMAKVVSALPQLAGYENRVRRRLSLTLMNRRSQIKNVLNWKRTAKLHKWQNALDLKNREETPPQQHKNNKLKAIKTLHIVKKRLLLEEIPHVHLSEHDKENDKKGMDDVPEDDDEDESEDDDFKFESGDEVHLMDGADKVGRASFIKQSKLDDENSIVALQSVYIDDVIVKDLKKQQRLLGSLKPGDRFTFKTNQLLKIQKKEKLNEKAAEKPTTTTKTPRSRPAAAVVQPKGWKGYVLQEAGSIDERPNKEFGPPAKKKRERRPKTDTDDYILF